MTLLSLGPTFFLTRNQGQDGQQLLMSFHELSLSSNVSTGRFKVREGEEGTPDIKRWGHYDPNRYIKWNRYYPIVPLRNWSYNGCNSRLQFIRTDQTKPEYKKTVVDTLFIRDPSTTRTLLSVEFVWARLNVGPRISRLESSRVSQCSVGSVGCLNTHSF